MDVVEMNVIMGAGMHSLVPCFAVNNSNLGVFEVFIRYDLGCARNMKMPRANRGGVWVRLECRFLGCFSYLTVPERIPCANRITFRTLEPPIRDPKP